MKNESSGHQRKCWNILDKKITGLALYIRQENDLSDVNTSLLDEANHRFTVESVPELCKLDVSW